MQNEPTCNWMKADGTQCKDTKLVPDAQFCYRHYWQALWMTTEIANSPLPARVDWGGIFTGLLLPALALISLVRNPNWVLPVWINVVSEVILNPRLTLNSSTALFLLGYFAMGFGLVFGIWLLYVEFCLFPLKPRTRRIHIIVGVAILIGLTLILLSCTISSLVIEHYINISWLVASLAFLTTIINVALVFYSAYTLKPKLIDTWGFRVVAMFAITIVAIPLFVIYFFQLEQVGLITEISCAAIGILIGYALLTNNGRAEIARYLTERAAALADAMRPVDARILGFSQATDDARRQALKKALELFSNLTPLEQQELVEYISIKRRPSILQIALGIISIILSAFLLEAPAQQAFVWFACDFLKMGVPLCP